MLLCQQCAGCLLGTAKVNHEESSPHGTARHYQHHPTVQNVREAAKGACQLCSELWLVRAYRLEELEKITHKSDCNLLNFSVTKDESKPDLPARIAYSVGCRCSDANWREDSGIHKELLPTSDAHFASGGGSMTTQTATSDTGSDECIGLARYWIQCCEEQHEKCMPRTKSNWYPTRLIDLTLFASAGIVRLVLTSKERPTTPYVTLSHCWGPNPFLKLTRNNFDDFIAGMAVQEFPKTFQDAFHVAYHLGVQYIWIDSLCIIQDDAGLADWIAESKYMDQVYTNGHCNISATASSGGHLGLFRQRDPRLIGYETFDSSSDSEKSSPYPFTVVDSMYWQTSIEEAPLHRRAWVFQERLLSRRILHFTRHELMWECREVDASETYPFGVPPTAKYIQSTSGISFEQLEQKLATTSHPEELHNLLRELATSNFKRLDALMEPVQPSHSVDVRECRELLYYWWHLQEQYSRAKLTMPDDRTVAISAMAKRFQILMNDQYRAGMWMKCLPTELLWRTDRFRQTGPKKPPQYNVPTFSWLSVQCPIDSLWRTTVITGDYEILFNVENLDLKFVSSDPTGFVKYGALFLRGYLVLVRLKPSERPGTSWDVCVGRLSKEIGEGHADVTRPDLPERSVEKDHYLIPLAQEKRSLTTYCLLLERKRQSTQKNALRRIGTMELYDKTYAKMLRRHSGRSGLEAYPCVSFDRRSGMHVLCIE